MLGSEIRPIQVEAREAKANIPLFDAWDLSFVPERAFVWLGSLNTEIWNLHDRACRALILALYAPGSNESKRGHFELAIRTLPNDVMRRREVVSEYLASVRSSSMPAVYSRNG